MFMNIFIFCGNAGERIGERVKIRKDRKIEGGFKSIMIPQGGSRES